MWGTNQQMNEAIMSVWEQLNATRRCDICCSPDSSSRRLSNSPLAWHVVWSKCSLYSVPTRWYILPVLRHLRSNSSPVVPTRLRVVVIFLYLSLYWSFGVSRKQVPVVSLHIICYNAIDLLACSDRNNGSKCDCLFRLASTLVRFKRSDARQTATTKQLMACDLLALQQPIQAMLPAYAWKHPCLRVEAKLVSKKTATCKVLHWKKTIRCNSADGAQIKTPPFVLGGLLKDTKRHHEKT